MKRRLTACEFCFFNPKSTRTKGRIYRVKSSTSEVMVKYISFLIRHHNYPLEDMSNSTGLSEYIEKV